MGSNENSCENIRIKNFPWLLCGLCEEILSVPPISFNHRFGVICGRCRTTVELLNDKTYRLSAYENLAKYFEYPCVFLRRGCLAILKWGKVLEHEISCPFSDDNDLDDVSSCEDGTKAASHVKFSSDWNKDFQDFSQLKFDEKLPTGKIREKSIIFPKGTAVKCHNCESYLKYPVYICINNHNICSNCWLDEKEDEEKFSHCTKCSTFLTRNTGMERLSYFLEYPCKNVTLGCAYTENSPNIEEHERKCGYSKKCCIPNCEYEGTDFLNHVSSTHEIDELGTSHKLTSSVFCTFIFDHRVFSLSGIFNAREGLIFEIICRGTDKTQYTFEIQITDNNYTKISIQDVCIPEYQNFKNIITEYNVEESMRKMFISGEMIQQLFVDYGSLNYRVNIMKMVV